MDRLTVDDLLTRSRARLERLTPEQGHAAVRSGATLIDIRSDRQRSAAGRVPGALVIPRNELEWRLDPDCSYRHPKAPPLTGEVIVMCNEGYQSSLVAATLQDMGFARATDVEGGFEAWRAAGLPVEPAD
jgi:rhodanese-related sulfurtransferase